MRDDLFPCVHPDELIYWLDENVENVSNVEMLLQVGDVLIAVGQNGVLTVDPFLLDFEKLFNQVL